MAIKVIIRRQVADSKVGALIPLLKRLRNLAVDQKEYISGETLKRIDAPGETLVVSTWQTIDAWRTWVLNAERADIQKEIDDLLGTTTQYEIYTYS